MGSSAVLRRWILRSIGAGIVRSPCRYNSSAAGVPWLILPPVHKGVYRFRSLAEDSAFSLNFNKGEEFPDDDAELVGSSHGWVALFNRRNNDLFLSHPPSQRCIKLPAMEKLPVPHFNLDLDGHGSVSKLILSSSPDDDEEECRAMMSFGPARRLAFCAPGRSSEWTPVGMEYLFIKDDHSIANLATVHDDMVYCSRRKVFTSVTPCSLYLDMDWVNDDYLQVNDKRINYEYDSMMYEWDIEDPVYPKKVKRLEGWTKKEERNGSTRIWLEEKKEFLNEQCIQMAHLVYAEQSDQLFLVLRFVMVMNPDDSGLPLGYIPDCPVKGLTDVFPGSTIGFVVMEIDEKGKCRVVDDLNGMSMLVGINHSFAVSSTQLSPNCIYYTDAKRIRLLHTINDTGVYDYAAKKITLPPSSSSHMCFMMM